MSKVLHASPLVLLENEGDEAMRAAHPVVVDDAEKPVAAHQAHHVVDHRVQHIRDLQCTRTV